jgi:hypothetical protein
MLYDIFGLPDCAAELINDLNARKISLPDVDSRSLLDAIAPNGDYKSYISGFDRDPKTFYPNATRHAAPVESMGEKEAKCPENSA